MIITHKIEMDLSRRGVTPRIDAVQGDALTRQIQLELYSNGTAWEIPEGVSALVRFVKPDGTGGIYDTLPDGTAACTIEGNTVSVILAPEVTTVSGAVFLAVTLIQGDAELSSFSMTINVQHNPNATVEGGVQNATLAAMVGKAVEAYMEENPVEVSNVVKTVNGTAPDENGNVEIDIPDSGVDAGYVLPVGGAELGGVKNGGNVVINADGTMTAPVSSDNTASGSTTGNVVCTFLDAYVAWKNGETFPVAFIGDSTFAGTGSGADKAFPVVLQELLREECGENATVYNVSVAGTSLGNGISSFESNFGETGTYADTKIICIGYGINDRLGHSTYQSYKNSVYANVETLVKKCFEKGIQPVIVTSQATSECGVASNYTQYPMRNAEAMNTCANGAKKDVSEKYGVPLIDLNRFTELYMTNSLEDVSAIIPDRLHFSAIGNKYEAGVMFKHFVPRTINYSGNDDKIISLSNQNLVCTIPEDKISYGGDYKVYANYAKSDSVDAKIIDAYLFVEDYPVLLNAVKNDANSGTYVKVNGDNYPIDGTAAILCKLDLGLHHLEVYTGASTSVDFCAFVVNALGIGQETVAVTGITLDKTELTVENSKEGTIVATVTPSDATNKKVIWTTDNENICSVSNGVVTGKGAGNCVVTATTSDGGFTATCNVTVTPVEMAIDTKGSTLETQSVGANFAVFTPNYDADAKTTALSNTTVKTVELNYSAAGTISFGKVNLNNATKDAVEDVKEYTVGTTGFVVIDIDDISLGENDAFCIVGGTASFLLLKAWGENEGYNLGWGGVVYPSSFGLYGRIVYE